MMKLILIFLLFNYSSESLDYDMYCKDLACEKEQHTVCLRKGDKCEPVHVCEDQPMTRELRQAAVDQHNEYRNKFASGKEADQAQAASNLMVINYDIELEYVMRCHIHTCTIDHDKCRKTKKFATVGQNMYAGNGRISAKLIKKAMASWYSEIKDMEPDIYTKYDDPASGKAIGHFTQLVWAKSEFIGCAASTDGKKLYFGCNYGPAGNVKGAGILKWGTPCTECENSLKCNQKYESLCGVLLPIPDSSPTPFKNKFYICFIFVVINLFI